MCGILFHLSSTPPTQSENARQSDLASLIQARGPDSFQSLHRTITTRSGNTLHATFSASVLALRGEGISRQPLVASSPRSASKSVAGVEISPGNAQDESIFIWNGEAWKVNDRVVTGNDSKVVFDLLRAAVSDTESTTTTTAGLDSDDNLGLAVRNALKTVTGPFAFLFYDAGSKRLFFGRDHVGRRSLVISGTQDQAVDMDLYISSATSTPLANSWEEVRTSGIWEIDLSESIVQAKLIPWIDETDTEETFFPRLNRLIDVPDDYSQPSIEVVGELEQRLETAVLLRTTATAPWLENSESSSGDQFAVLFSGGVDCTLIAYMLDRVLPPNCTIDLINVAFENPRVVAAASKQGSKNNESSKLSTSAYDACPDRKTGMSSYEELCRICPSRKWKFVEVNVPYTETLSYKSIVTSLMYPHSTEMDLSISLALFFASRGQGEIKVFGNPQAYRTQAKVLFSGLGADEVFGGYTRHTKAFSNAGLEGLLDELDLDFGRIGQRNLGRDDRVATHWGREIRYPYLDEDLTRWALALPIWEKCGFARPSGGSESLLDPGKLVLRMVAAKVGLVAASAEKKRAIQFGARTAKMTAGRVKGTDSIGD